jgi:hypothetical protein
MTKQEFIEKYKEFELFDTQDVLMRIASNLSDLQNEDNNSDKINSLKEYIFDYKSVLKSKSK